MKYFVLVFVTACLLAFTSCGENADAAPLGRLVFDAFDETTHSLALLAYIDEVQIYLYSGEYEGMILFHNNRRFDFPDWVRPSHRGVLPQILYSDFDGDSTDELVIIVHTGSGTGVSVANLHILTSNGAVHTLADWNIKDWFNPPVHALPYGDAPVIRLNFADETFVAFERVQDWHGGPFQGLSYGNIVNFEFIDGDIFVGVSISAFFEDCHGSYPLGGVNARVSWGGGTFTLCDYTFTPYQDFIGNE